MRTLYLHIGHGKTGSSYIQSALALSGDVFLRHHIAYPQDATIKDAGEGRISSGNGSIFISALDGSRLELPTEDRTLFSSEQFFGRLRLPQVQAQFLAQIEQLHVRSLKVLLYLRDPVSNACSSYQQAVKRGGYTRSLTEFFRNFPRPAHVNEVLDFLQTVPIADVTVHNYSACRNDILAKVEDWLCLDHGALIRPQVDNINRSLTHAELDLQLRINRFVGRKSGGVLVDHLCNAAPHIQADDIRPSVAEQEALWARLRDDISRVNARIPQEARYCKDRDIGPPTIDRDQSQFCFSAEQLDVIAQQLASQAKELGRLRQHTRMAAPKLESEGPQSAPQDKDAI